MSSVMWQVEVSGGWVRDATWQTNGALTHHVTDDPTVAAWWEHERSARHVADQLGGKVHKVTEPALPGLQ